jgi:hypothetical protein
MHLLQMPGGSWNELRDSSIDHACSFRWDASTQIVVGASYFVNEFASVLECGTAVFSGLCTRTKSSRAWRVIAILYRAGVVGFVCPDHDQDLSSIICVLTGCWLQSFRRQGIFIVPQSHYPRFQSTF